MRRFILSSSVAVSLALTAFVGAGTALAATPGTYQVMIMTHLCNSSIKNTADFNNMENGKSPILNLGDDVLACPTTGLVSSTPVAGAIAASRTTYDFSVTSDTQTQTLAGNGTFTPVKACESDLGLDLNGDGVISSTTCLDVSHYMIPITTSSGSSTILKVLETQAPAGYHFGILRFTPVALDGNNDSQDLTNIDPSNGEIDLNAVPDTDGMIMLHVYQFLNTTTGSGGTGTTTGSVGGTGTTTTPMSGPGTISGNVFNDQNNNGSKDGSEPGIVSFTINLHQGSNDSSPVMMSATSDASGNYSFGSLASGNYYVEEINKNGWTQTSDDMKVVLNTSNSSATVNFANVMMSSGSGSQGQGSSGNGNSGGNRNNNGGNSGNDNSGNNSGGGSTYHSGNNTGNSDNNQDQGSSGKGSSSNYGGNGTSSNYSGKGNNGGGSNSGNNSDHGGSKH